MTHGQGLQEAAKAGATGPSRARRRLAALVLAALALAACGGDDDTDSSPGPTPTTTVEDAPATDDEPTPAAPGDADGASPGGDDTTAAEPDSPTEGAEQPDDDAAVDVAERAVVITTPDDEQLSGTIFGEGEVGVVLAHMRGRDQTTWFEFARQAAAEGYQILTFDFRGYGGSSGERDTALDIDLDAAVAAIRAEGTTRTVIIGASMGGTAVVNAAGELDLSGAVSISAPAEFLGLPALDVAVNVGEPLLVVAAEDDQPYADAAVGIADRAPASQLILFEGNAHGTNIFDTHERELTNLLLSFLRDRTS